MGAAAGKPAKRAAAATDMVTLVAQAPVPPPSFFLPAGDPATGDPAITSSCSALPPRESNEHGTPTTPNLPPIPDSFGKDLPPPTGFFGAEPDVPAVTADKQALAGATAAAPATETNTYVAAIDGDHDALTGNEPGLRRDSGTFLQCTTTQLNNGGQDESGDSTDKAIEVHASPAARARQDYDEQKASPSVRAMYDHAMIEGFYPELRGLVPLDGADIDAKDATGLTPLAKAVAVDSLACVGALLDAGADPTVKLGGGFYVVHFAAETGNAAVLQRLLAAAGVDPDVRDAEGLSPLARAVLKGHFGCVAALVVCGVDPNLNLAGGRSLLHEAAQRGNAQVVQMLLNAHATVDATTESGETALMCSAAGEVTQRLLDAGADAMLCDSAGRTALEAACAACLGSSVQALVRSCPGVVQHSRARLLGPGAGGEACLWQRMMAEERFSPIVGLLAAQAPDLRDFRDLSTGASAYDAAAPACRVAVDAALAFCGRFALLRCQPLHCTRSVVAFRAADLQRHRQEVVVKLIRDFSQAKLEGDAHRRVSTNHVAPCQAVSSEPAFRDRWGSEAARWGYKEYPHGLVYEAGMHDLMWVLSHMHQSSAQARDVLRQVAQCLAHMHQGGRIVGDLHPSHIVQMHGSGAWKLASLHASVECGQPAGLNASEALMPPEMVHHDPAQQMFEVKSVHLSPRGELTAEGRAYLPVPAAPSLDVWAFGALMFHVVTGRSLLHCDGDARVRQAELSQLFHWDERSAHNHLREVGLNRKGSKDHSLNAAACDLIQKLLQRDPRARPASMSQVLEHPFFTEAEIDVSSMAPLPLPNPAAKLPGGTPVQIHGPGSAPRDPEGTNKPGIFVCSGANSGKEARQLQSALVEVNPILRGRVWVGPQDENHQLATSDGDRRAAVNAHSCFVLYLTSDVFKDTKAAGVEIPEALKLNRNIILVKPIDEDIDGFHCGDTTNLKEVCKFHAEHLPIDELLSKPSVRYYQRGDYQRASAQLILEKCALAVPRKSIPLQLPPNAKIPVVFEQGSSKTVAVLLSELERICPDLLGVFSLCPDGKGKHAGGVKYEIFFITKSSMNHFGIIGELHSAKMNKRATIVVHDSDGGADGISASDVAKSREWKMYGPFVAFVNIEGFRHVCAQQILGRLGAQIDTDPLSISSLPTSFESGFSAFSRPDTHVRPGSSESTSGTSAISKPRIQNELTNANDPLLGSMRFGGRGGGRGGLLSRGGGQSVSGRPIIGQRDAEEPATLMDLTSQEEMTSLSTMHMKR